MFVRKKRHNPSKNLNHIFFLHYFQIDIRYVVIKKLGWGHFSTVWMVKDKKVNRNKAPHETQYYALKVQKSAEHYTEAAMDEVELLDCVSNERERISSSSLSGTDMNGIPWDINVKHSKHVAMLKDSFFHNGPNGKHMCMVFHMLGCNLLSVIKAYDYRGVPIPAVKTMIKGICQGLDFLHRKCQIIHTDLKPENVLLEFSENMEEDDGSNSDDDDMSSSLYLGGSRAISIEELEQALQNPKISSDERKILKKKLKKRKQKEKKRLDMNKNNMSRYDREVNELADRLSGLSPGNDTVPGILPILSDIEMERILHHKRSSTSWNSNSHLAYSSTVGDSVSSHRRVLSILNHSPFVSLNFSPKQNEGLLMQETFKEHSILQPANDIDLKNQLYNSDTVAEITFLLRAYVPEGEIADNVSKALGMSWKRSNEKGIAREWYVHNY